MYFNNQLFTETEKLSGYYTLFVVILQLLHKVTNKEQCKRLLCIDMKVCHNNKIIIMHWPCRYTSIEQKISLQVIAETSGENYREAK